MVHTVIRRGCLTALAILMAASLANATPMWFRDGDGLTDPGVTITFDELGLAEGTVITNQYANIGGSQIGASFSPLLYQMNSEPVDFAGIEGAHLWNRSGPGGLPIQDPFSIVFSTPVNAAAVALATNPPPGGVPQVPGIDFTTISLFLGAAQVGGPITAFTFDNLPLFAYIGVTNVVFDRMVIDAQANGSARIDNLQFTAVPEPATMALVGAGALGLLARARRRRSHQA